MADIYKELERSYGNQFQILFTKLMKEKYGIQYHATSTYGNKGDMSVDGVLNYNTAFAVYAPETYSDQKTISKIKSDFDGFLSWKKKGEWQSIQLYVFVIKREREGVTSTVLNLVSELNKIFPLKIMTMQDLRVLSQNYLPLSSDGQLLMELKEDITEILEYIIETDFSSQAFCISFLDDIDGKIISKWSKKKYSFSNKKIQIVKNKILNMLIELCHYLSYPYVRSLSAEKLIFDNTSPEAGERLRTEMRPQIHKIRIEAKKLLEELDSIDYQ